ncbi:hypothetical protein F4806DRAFT_472465 [Annulohypoxylon nitens]|nr:hypothetical protein F4806DRAFT_472465 [Annulohypoxylon nitens]KAI1445522.1 hypothetical protein F5Y02DRAFT_418050 [Annulohypoxylon stygium]
MKTKTLFSSALLLTAKSVLANNAIPDSAFSQNNGIAAAQAAAPAWFMASGTCMPSAAEDGQGHQTNGVDTDNCNINKLSNGCPQQPSWQGANTFYGNIAGEPFSNIPTYYNVVKCGNQWKIIYYVYFKKDTGHKSDWEGVVIAFNDQGGGSWTRTNMAMEQDGKHPWIDWDKINDTYDSNDDFGNWGQKSRDHAKVYFGKWHHSAHTDWHTTTFKNTCPPTSGDDFRNADYQFKAVDNLRHVSVLNPSWNWGKASSPVNIDVCKF